MLILLTNDDGIRAPGLLAMWRELVKLGEVHVVAPEVVQSATGHGITLDAPILTSKVTIENALTGPPATVPMAVKITTYRMIQEALANGWWHARGCAQRVRISMDGGNACVEVSDQGPGFDVRRATESGRLGLALLSERVRILGGHIEINSITGMGTIIKAWLPLTPIDQDDDV